MRAILTWHAIDRTGSAISVTPEQFRRQVESLARARIPVVSIAELRATPADRSAVTLTFDDALDSVASEGAPVLAEHGFTATVFAVSDHVGKDNRWQGAGDAGVPLSAVLDWDALGHLREGGWTIGSHSRHHPHLTQCSDAQLTDELAGAAEMIDSSLGERPTVFAYPYGSVDARVARATAVHYQAACTTRHLPLDESSAAMELPRLDAWYFTRPDPFAGWGSARFTRSIQVRDALRRIRRALR